MQLILTAIGDDRPGLTKALADAIADAGGNWLESQFSTLGGYYVGSVLVELPDERLDGLKTAVREIDASGFSIEVQPLAETHEPTHSRAFCFDLVASDRPGIVREVSTAIAELGASIDELETGTETEAWSGQTMFRARVCVAVPDGMSAEKVRDKLEEISGEMMVDIED